LHREQHDPQGHALIKKPLMKEALFFIYLQGFENLAGCFERLKALPLKKI
jgi:hypothetical protein